MFVGIDLGTQSLKAVVVDDELRVHGRGAAAYPTRYPRPGWAEQETSDWERALPTAIAQALADGDVAPARVAGLAICGQLDGCVPVDHSGAAAGPALIWMDRRAVAFVPDALPRDFHERTGIIADAGHMAAKVAWCLNRGVGARFHQPVSYLVERLTGEFVFDPAHASTTMVFELGSSALDPGLCGAFGFEPSHLPQIAPAHGVAGVLRGDAASWLGLPKGIAVAVGTGDDFATPFGAGVMDGASVVCVLGTAEVVGAVSQRPLLDREKLVECHAYLAGRFFIENPGWLSGGAIVWARNLLGFASDEELDSAASSVSLAVDPLTFVPALTGAMAPRWHAGARGCFYGLTPRHRPAHLARAVLEGCAFAMYDVLSRLRSLGMSPLQLLALGGGAASGTWLQIRSDLSGLPVHGAVGGEHCALAAAALATVAAGAIDSVETAARLVEPETRIYEPRDGPGRDLRAAHGRYRRLFDALEPLFDEPCT